MATNAYYRTSLIGGGIALDGIDGDLLNSNDMAICSVSGDFYVYRLDASNSSTENSPYIIAPDTNPGTKRWVQQQVPWVSDTGSMFLTSNLVKDPQRVPWWVGFEDDVGVGGDAATILALNAATSWTRIGYAGAAIQLAVGSDDIYDTVVDVTGSAGVVTNLFLPGVTAASDVVTLKITIDGTEHTVAFTAANATDRFVCGVIGSLVGATGVSHFTAWGDAARVSGLATRLPEGGTTTDHLLLSPGNTLGAAPCLRFESSLKVEMKSSDVSTSSQRDYCGVAYFLDQ